MIDQLIGAAILLGMLSLGYWLMFANWSDTYSDRDTMEEYRNDDRVIGVSHIS